MESTLSLISSTIIFICFFFHCVRRYKNKFNFWIIDLIEYLIVIIMLCIFIKNFIFIKVEDKERYASAYGITVSYSVNPEKTEIYANYIDSYKEELIDMVLNSGDDIPFGSNKHMESIQKVYDQRFGEGIIKINDISLKYPSLADEEVLEAIHEKIEDDIANKKSENKFTLFCILILIILGTLIVKIDKDKRANNSKGRISNKYFFSRFL